MSVSFFTCDTCREATGKSEQDGYGRCHIPLGLENRKYA